MKRLFATSLSLALALSGLTPALASQPTLPIDQCKLIGNNTAGTNHRFEDSGHIEDWSRFLKPIGLIRMIVIPMDFSDVPAKKPASSELGFLRNVSSFFATKSQGKMQLEIDSSMDWVRMPKTAAHYKKAFWADKINEAIDLVDPVVDFSKFDLVLFYISKHNKITTEAGALPGFPDRKPDGLSLIRGVYLGNDYWRQQGHHAGVTIHETLHVFGLPDLYQANKDGTKNLGAFDIMAEYDPKVGLTLLNWNRWKLGWIDDSQVICLNPRIKQTMSVSRSTSPDTLWVLPIDNRNVAVIQSWVTRSRAQAIAYEVDTRDMVWNSAGLSGSGESPIQMLRPVRAGKAPGRWALDSNLKVILRNKDIVNTRFGKLRVSKSGSGLTIVFNPR